MRRVLNFLLSDNRAAYTLFGAALGVLGVLLYDVFEDNFLEDDKHRRYRRDLAGWMTPQDVSVYYGISAKDVARIIDTSPGSGDNRGPRTMSEIAAAEGKSLDWLEDQFQIMSKLAHTRRDR